MSQTEEFITKIWLQGKREWSNQKEDSEEAYSCGVPEGCCLPLP